jgi:hypothetical protein
MALFILGLYFLLMSLFIGVMVYWLWQDVLTDRNLRRCPKCKSISTSLDGVHNGE